MPNPSGLPRVPSSRIGEHRGGAPGEGRDFSPTLRTRRDRVSVASANLGVDGIRAGTAEDAVRGMILLVLVTSPTTPVIDWR